MQIVLVEPEIPQNTGNIARTCALTKTTLHLVKPLGFSITDRYLKRAGLDYWDKVVVKVWEDFDELVQIYGDNRFFMATTHATKFYNEYIYSLDDFLVLGSESKGLPKALLTRYSQNLIRIPMLDIGRSLNLANSAAIILFEALRQNAFPGLK